MPDLVPYISDSDEDDAEVRWTSTGSGVDNILSDHSDDDDDSIGLLVTEAEEVGHACSSRAIVDLSMDSDTESDASAEEVVDQEVTDQPQQVIDLDHMLHPHNIVDRDGLETTMVSTNIFRAFNRSGLFAREFIRYLRHNFELCSEMERQGIEARVPIGEPTVNDGLVLHLRQIGGLYAATWQNAEEVHSSSDSNTPTAGAEESSSEGSTPSGSIISVEAPVPSSPDIVSVEDSSEESV